MMKYALKNALIFGIIFCAISAALTGGLSFFLWIPIGVALGVIFFLAELLYLRIYKKIICNAGPSEYRIYKIKMITHSTVVMGLLVECAFFACGILSIVSKGYSMWNYFLYSIIFALLAYAFFIGAAIAEFYFLRDKRYLIKACSILSIGAVGLVSYGYNIVGSIFWTALSAGVFIFELISILIVKKIQSR